MESIWDHLPTLDLVILVQPSGLTCSSLEAGSTLKLKMRLLFSVNALLKPKASWVRETNNSKAKKMSSEINLSKKVKREILALMVNNTEKKEKKTKTNNELFL